MISIIDKGRTSEHFTICVHPILLDKKNIFIFLRPSTSFIFRIIYFFKVIRLKLAYLVYRQPLSKPGLSTMHKQSGVYNFWLMTHTQPPFNSCTGYIRCVQRFC